MTPEAPEQAAATPTVHTLNLHFSPRRSRCGLVSYARSGKRMTVLVVPQLWSATAYARKPTSADTHWWLVVPEGTRLTFANLDEDWYRLAKGAAEWLASVAEGDEADPEDAEDDDLDPSVRKSLKQLVSVVSGKGATADEPSDEQQVFSKNLDALFHLVLRTEHLDRMNQMHAPDEALRGHMLDEGTSLRHRPFKLFIAERFLRLVESRQREIRQGYVPRTERTQLLRGRISTNGIVQWEARGRVGGLECTYDEFTSATPLFQVIVSTLEAIALGTVLPRWSADLERWSADLRDRALHLRRQLAHIPPLPRTLAATLAGRIRLNRMLRTWEPALGAAKILLRDLPLDLRTPEKGESGVAWTVKSPDLWEAILAQVLGERGAIVRRKTNPQKPWGSLGRAPEIDLEVWDNDRRFIFDAKYKVHDKLISSPADRYQVFAYSLLPDKEKVTKAPKPAHAVALIYPRKSDPEPASSEDHFYKGPFQRGPVIGEQTDAARPMLHLLKVEFPTQEDVHDDAAWSEYLKRACPPFDKIFGANVQADEEHTHENDDGHLTLLTAAP